MKQIIIFLNCLVSRVETIIFIYTELEDFEKLTPSQTDEFKKSMKQTESIRLKIEEISLEKIQNTQLEDHNNLQKQILNRMLFQLVQFLQAKGCKLDEERKIQKQLQQLPIFCTLDFLREQSRILFLQSLSQIRSKMNGSQIIKLSNFLTLDIMHKKYILKKTDPKLFSTSHVIYPFGVRSDDQLLIYSWIHKILIQSFDLTEDNTKNLLLTQEYIGKFDNLQREMLYRNQLIDEQQKQYYDKCIVRTQQSKVIVQSINIADRSSSPLSGTYDHLQTSGTIGFHLLRMVPFPLKKVPSKPISIQARSAKAFKEKIRNEEKIKLHNESKEGKIKIQVPHLIHRLPRQYYNIKLVTLNTSQQTLKCSSFNQPLIMIDRVSNSKSEISNLYTPKMQKTKYLTKSILSKAFRQCHSIEPVSKKYNEQVRPHTNSGYKTNQDFITLQTPQSAILLNRKDQDKRNPPLELKDFLQGGDFISLKMEESAILQTRTLYPAKNPLLIETRTQFSKSKVLKDRSL